MAYFEVLQGPVQAVERWLGASTAPQRWHLGGVGLAVWGGGQTAPDGRADGAFAGVLLSDSEVAVRLLERGLAIEPSKHERLAVVDAALHGPLALSEWRWQGSVACLHHAQRQVLVANDPSGVGYVGYGRSGDLQVWTNRLDSELPLRPLAPGTLLLVQPTGVKAQRLSLSEFAQPFLRQRPADLDATLLVPPHRFAEELHVRLRKAIAACERGRGGLALAADPAPLGPPWADWCRLWQLRPAGQSPGGARWSLLGSAELLGGPLPHTAPPSLPAFAAPWPGEPFEPTERCDDADRAERLWRFVSLPGLFHPARLAAARHSAVLVAPHLDPAVVAWLGAAPRSWRQFLALGPATP